MGLVLQVLIPLALLAMATMWIVALFRRSEPRQQSTDKARQLFQLRREWLEARFFTLASASGRPRGLRWVECDFDHELTLARDRSTGDLKGFVACTVQFEAIEGGGMEENPNVGNLRLATAVFHHQRGNWSTDGRTLFNLNPHQAIERFAMELETVE